MGTLYYSDEASSILCPDKILDVLLPAVSGQTSTVSYYSAPLYLDFTAVRPPAGTGAFCEYTSSIGTLRLALGFFGVLSVPATSTTMATWTLIKPFTLSSLPGWDYSQIVNNGALLNGPFAPSHYYINWASP